MILDLAEPHFGGHEKMATVLFENVALHAQPIILAAKPGDLCRRVGGEMQGRRCAPIRPPRISPSAPITPVAKHRGCDAQLPCDLRPRPTAAPQQGNRLPLELIRKLTTALAHSTPFRSPRSLAKGPPIRGGHNLPFRWFVGVGGEGAVWDHSTFSKNRDRLLDGEIAAKFLSAVLAQPRVKRLLSSGHFSGEGTLIEARASMKR